jgi:hypothetical protein
VNIFPFPLFLELCKNIMFCIQVFYFSTSSIIFILLFWNSSSSTLNYRAVFFVSVSTVFNSALLLEFAKFRKSLFESVIGIHNPNRAFRVSISNPPRTKASTLARVVCFSPRICFATDLFLIYQPSIEFNQVDFPLRRPTMQLFFRMCIIFQ